MNTTLNNYTIDDFLKLKPIIYEYCVNLTQKRTLTSWDRDFEDANDLYQDVYIYVHDQYFNKPKEPIHKGKFIQIMKNCTYWTYHQKYTRKNNKIINDAQYFQKSRETEFHFSEKLFEYPTYFEDIKDNPDYNFAMKGLKFSERLAINYFLKGYTKTEIAKKFNKNYTFISSIVKKIETNMLMDNLSKPLIKLKPIVEKPVIYNDVVFVREKLPNFDKIFKKTKNIKSFENDRKIRMYSLYLQGMSNKNIAKELGKPTNQINQEIFRINQKIKKYAI